jgi:hypothetical protein
MSGSYYLGMNNFSVPRRSQRVKEMLQRDEFLSLNQASKSTEELSIVNPNFPTS